MADKADKQGFEIPGYLKFSKIITWLLYFWVMFGVAMLTLRVFLLAFSANLSAGFSRFAARTSADYMQPFDGIFPGKDIGETGYFDVSATFAIIVYLFLAWAFKALIDYVQNKIDTTKQEQIAEKANRERNSAKTAQGRAKRG